MKGFVALIIIAVMGFTSCENKKEEKATPEVSTPPPDTGAIVQAPLNSPYNNVDISPMDMSYFPVDYPKLKMTKSITTGPLARVIYSRPHLQRRKLFPDILKHGEPWRLGANEATELQLFVNARIEDKQIPAGRYSMYCIPQPERWTIIINSNIDTWGLQPDSTKDIARFDVPVKKLPWRLEYFSMVFEKTPTGAELLMAWDDLETRLPIRF